MEQKFGLQHRRGDGINAQGLPSLRDLWGRRLLTGALPLPGRLVLTIVFRRPFGTLLQRARR